MARIMAVFAEERRDVCIVKKAYLGVLEVNRWVKEVITEYGL